MRISDWSSDVCSSDLGVGGHRPALRRATAGERNPRRAGDRARRVQFGDTAVDGRTPGVGRGRVSMAAALALGDADHQLPRVILPPLAAEHGRSEEHTSELPSLMRISYAVFCLKNKT